MEDGLDHILFAARNLEAGCAVIEAATGVKPAFGGAHPGRGTCNALAALGPGLYLEVIAPDPDQSADNDLVRRLRAFEQPALAWWAARATGLAAIRERLSPLGIATSEIKQGHRITDAGERVQWQALYLTDDRFGAATPFLIDWGSSPSHPSETAPQAGRLVGFEVALPALSAFRALTEAVAFGPLVTLREGESAAMTARIETPAGKTIELRTGADFPAVYPPRS